MSSTVVTAGPRKSIAGYWGDVLLGGGLSILLFVPLSAAGVFVDEDIPLRDVLFTSLLLNWPHFLASYRLLYGKDGTHRRHPWAAWYIPGALLAFVVVGALVARWG